MNNNHVFFRGNAAASASRDVRAKDLRVNNQLTMHGSAHPPTAGRHVLTAVWRRNPASGRLECHWTWKRSVATDEGVSCSGILYRAA